ncbi:hypothetical protein OF83DRAFT_1175512 [Amylostereum chailletii]|nr:hypothetical protein OF83DRAFT_1175512 [Amylostereum chailletii]
MSFLLDALIENKPEQAKPEQAHLETRLLEMNLLYVPQITDVTLGNEVFSYSDRPRVANLQVYEKIATKKWDIFGPIKVGLSVSFKTLRPYYHLGSIAATRTGQIWEVERLCLEPNHCNPEKVENSFKEAKLQDQLPLIIVYDRFDCSMTLCSLLASVTGNYLDHERQFYVMSNSNWSSTITSSSERRLWSRIIHTVTGSLTKSVILTGAPECTDAIDASLIEILEKIILEPFPFGSSDSLLSMFVLTIIRVDEVNVNGHINKFQRYEIAEIQVTASNKEAFAIYEKRAT